MKKRNSCPICRIEIKNCITNKGLNFSSSTRESISNINSYLLDNINDDKQFIDCLVKIQKTLHENYQDKNNENSQDNNNENYQDNNNENSLNIQFYTQSH